MAESSAKSLFEPDESIRLPGLVEHVVDLGDISVGRSIVEPGWRWSTHVRPTVGGEWCQVRHVGIVLAGRLGALFEDGTTIECEPYDAYHIPPGHDGYVIGDEPAELVEWTGARAFVGFRVGPQQRVLATLLFTDLVGSTEMAEKLGDGPWRTVLSAFFEAARTEIGSLRGREVKTTGDGLLATFDGAARALHCAAAIRRAAARQGLQVRMGIHVGEVEQIGSDVRGVAVHEAARIMGIAGAGEILVSEITRTLAQASGFEFDDRGVHELKGLAGECRIYAFAGDGTQE